MTHSTNYEENYNGLLVSGFLMLFINLIIIPAIAVYSISIAINEGSVIAAAVAVILGILFLFCSAGYFTQEPNEGRVILFFGKYRGTCRSVGFYWMNPLNSKRKISLRIRNMDIEPIKVNDKTGNPVMIGMVLVWRIKDTYRAAFDIDSQSLGAVGNAFNSRAFENFVAIQSDAALREVTGHFPYDASNDSEPSLRSSAEEINGLLENKINERLDMAGMEVVEARINYLAYAPEIAAVMLKRQQAAAVISAREKIVEGAVSMVSLALDRIENEDVAKFSAEQRAKIVSNLMMVLCSDEPVSPVINANS